MTITHTILSTALALTIATSAHNSFAQCPASYSAEIFAGPDCRILPSFARARGIGESGAICGGFLDCGEVDHPVIWSGTGEITELPPSNDPGYPDPLAMNSTGEVVGNLFVPGLDHRAFLFSGGITLNLGTLPGDNWSEAYAINEAGAVCGASNNTSTGPLRAFVWQSGQMSPMELPFGNSSVANDISDTGSVCGWMGNMQSEAHAFIHDLGSGTTLDVGTALASAVGATAKGINNTGSICGYSVLPCGKLCFTRRAFIWTNGTPQDLGVLPGFLRSLAHDLSDSNVVVGDCDMVPTNNVTRAFIWQNGVMQALNDLVPPELNLNIRIAWDINNAGQIVASATQPGSSDQLAVRLTPIASPSGDFNCDSAINVLDLLGVIREWGNTISPADFDNDRNVGLPDLMVVIDNWG